jgi:hypothetical protein
MNYQEIVNLGKNTAQDTTLTELATNKATATDGQILTSNGDGTSEFKTPSAAGASIVNDLTTGGATAVLSAEMGKTLNTNKADKAQEGWIAPTLLNSWVNYGAPFANAGYFKDTLGLVHLRGVMKDGSGLGTAIFNLPSGYRPSAQVNYPSVSNGLFCLISVQTNGDVVHVSGGSMAWTSLADISFRAV